MADVHDGPVGFGQALPTPEGKSQQDVREARDRDKTTTFACLKEMMDFLKAKQDGLPAEGGRAVKGLRATIGVAWGVLHDYERFLSEVQ